MEFEVLGELRRVETFAFGKAIRELARLQKVYGRGFWRKRKALAYVRLSDGSVHLAELHWYEAGGIGKRELKVKSLVEHL